ncbi:MAG: 2,3,4,5-tetrahydropyridine-2,6-dicarboxylate N-succinyltransferase, partial [Planctomycetota bacterium]
MAPMTDLQNKIEAAFDDRTLLQQKPYEDAVLAAVEMLDKGKVRVAEPVPGGSDSDLDGGWVIHGWLQKACMLYFAVAEMELIDVPPFQFHDKVPLKQGLDQAKVRLVPPGTIRYGAFVEPGAVVMPGYVNIGARVGARTMVDTWATVGSCAQIGADVHLSGGVGIGGVLEPPGARPVIIEDGAFLGSRCIVVEGCQVGQRAV